MSASALVSQLKNVGEDFEFYPTTDEIIVRMIDDIESLRYGHHFSRRSPKSFLDIGAGHGKVLRAVQERAGITELYAIEKSTALCQRLDASVFIIGTAFEEQNLLSKKVDITFCNPPYSVFEDWAERIIRESASPVVYLVIPVRWKDSVRIQDALKFRSAELQALGEFSFIDAEDRSARAKVNLLRVELMGEDDAFDRFFNEQFAGLRAKFEVPALPEGAAASEYDPKTGVKRKGPPVNPKFASLVVGPDYPDRLVALYNEELDHIRRNYDLMAALDADLLKEFDVSPARVLACLKARLEGLRNTYWAELFANMSQVTDRLTSRKRKLLLDKLNANGHVDFTVTNIHAVILWVLKNANNYIDAQLVETFESMVDKANVRNYVSNTRAFVYDRWRYAEEKPSHIALEYRLVLEHVGGIASDWSGNRGLDNRGCEFIGDLLTVARNLGFDCKTVDERLACGHSGSTNQRWKSGTKHLFTFKEDGKEDTLVEVRAFLNSNLHVRLNQKFALALNVEMGRLKGWVRSGQEAAEELGDPAAAAFFAKNLQIGQSSLLMLAAPAGCSAA